MTGWVLTSAVVIYRCGGCGQKFARQVLPDDMNVPVGAMCARCGGLVGIHHVAYNTTGDSDPAPAQPGTFVPTNDLAAAKALGINLQPGGIEYESEDDDDLPRN